MKLDQLPEVFPNLSTIDLDVQQSQIVFSILLVAGISAIILYLLPLTILTRQLFQGFWASVEEEY